MIAGGSSGPPWGLFIGTAGVFGGLAMFAPGLLLYAGLAAGGLILLVAGFWVYEAVETNRAANRRFVPARSQTAEFRSQPEQVSPFGNISLRTDQMIPDGNTQKPRKRSKREARKEKTLAWVREQTLKNGHPPPFKVVKGRFHLKQATASRWRSEALRAVND
jgi:hypothetical protein